MAPSLSLEAEQTAEEVALLAKLKAGMSAAELTEVVAATQRLKARQAAADSDADVAKLPRLDLADLERAEREIPIEVDARSGGRVTFLRHELPSSGILYADVCFDASALTLDEAALLPLLTSALLETGTARKDRVALSQEIGTHTGGLRTATLLAQPATAGGLVAPSEALFSYVCVRGKATAAKAGRLFDLVHGAGARVRGRCSGGGREGRGRACVRPCVRACVHRLSQGLDLISRTLSLSLSLRHTTHYARTRARARARTL
jgi:hypothetical protein